MQTKSRSCVPTHQGRNRSSVGELEDRRRRTIGTRCRCRTEPRILCSLSGVKRTFSHWEKRHAKFGTSESDTGRMRKQKGNCKDKMAQFFFHLLVMEWLALAQKMLIESTSFQQFFFSVVRCLCASRDPWSKALWTESIEHSHSTQHHTSSFRLAATFLSSQFFAAMSWSTRIWSSFVLGDSEKLCASSCTSSTCRGETIPCTSVHTTKNHPLCIQLRTPLVLVALT